MKLKKTFLGAFFLLFSQHVVAKTVRYELIATKGNINLSGKKMVDFALMLNGGIPAPTLEFTEGDEAEIVVHNKIPNDEVSIHWHGILLPPEMDGVAYVNTPPIYSGQSHTFRFKLRHSGTYWYHSHTNVQEQKGIYGAFIVHPKNKTIQVARDIAVVLSDWSDEDASQIVKNLRKDGDYYIYKKDTMRSWAGAIRAKSLGNYLYNEWTRMGGMDLSDVGYDAFLINGKKDSQLATVHPDEKIRLRIINAAASSYFHISIGQTPMKVVAADGIDIKPVLAKEILIGMAETYDVVFEAPDHKNYELRATVQDGTGHASAWIGMADKEKVKAPDKPMPDLYATMDHGSHGGHAAHQEHAAHGVPAPSHTDHHIGHGTASTQAQPPHSSLAEHVNHANHQKPKPKTGHEDHHSHHGMMHSAGPTETLPLVDQLTVDEIEALEKTEFPKTSRFHDVKLVLGGDMERYVWHINGKAIYQDRTIEIREGDVVRFILVNETMMHHPMHLHGHFFRVQNKNAETSPLKHTVDVPPHGTRTIEFLANEPGEWMLHCHNLYHMKTGMARVVKYSSYTPSKEIASHRQHDPHLHDHIYYDGLVEIATNHAQLGFRLSKTWDTLDAHVETREYDSFDHVEGDLLYHRWFSQYLNLIAGATNFDGETRGAIGVGYTLPMLIETTLLIDHKGEVRLDLEKKFQWAKHIFTDAEVSFRQNKKTEFEISLMYAQSWAWAAGLKFTEDAVGIGAQYKF